jgi:hypothetical protein
VVIDRRTFLKATGLSVAGVGAASQALAMREGGPTTGSLPTQFAGDAITAQAAALGFDRDRIHRFVADEVAYEPYAGVLRGANTTLLGRAGNGADKAVLLAALLWASAIETRFVTGILDDAAAATLAATTVAQDPLRARARAALRGDQAAQVPAPAPDPAIQALLDRMPEIDAAVTTWASEAIDTSVRQIIDALAGAGITLPAGTGALPDTERTRHLWVQARSGTEWLDLDPTLAGTEPGASIASVVGDALAAVPDDLRHRLDIDLVIEKVAGAGVTQEAIIEHSRFADELTDVPIAIGHAKPQALQQLGAGIESLISGGTRYLAVLQVGATGYVGLSPLILSGGEDADASAGIDVFGPTGAGTREGEAVAEWLELRVTAPDGTVSTARRTLFDRIGAEARLLGPVDPAAIAAVELVDLDADHPAEFLPLTAAHFLSVATGAKAWPSAEFPEGQEALALGLPVQMYHVTRDATNAVLSTDRGVAIHLAAPNVTMHSYEPVPGADGRVAAVNETLDLLHRGFGGLAVEGAMASVPAGLLAGVTSHIAERVRGAAGLPADLAPSSPGISVGALFERAVAEGIGLRVLRGELPSDPGYPAAAAALLAEALAEGWVAVAPERPVQLGGDERLGWWLVDPTTGATRDQMDDGRGVEMAEGTLVTLLLFVFGEAVGLILGACIAQISLNVRSYLEALEMQMPGAGWSAADVPIRNFACTAI